MQMLTQPQSVFHSSHTLLSLIVVYFFCSPSSDTVSPCGDNVVHGSSREKTFTVSPAGSGENILGQILIRPFEVTCSYLNQSQVALDIPFVLIG